MNAHARLNRLTFTAWRATPGSTRAEAQPCKPITAATHAEALSAALTGNAIAHKDRLMVLERDEVSGKQMLRVYAIKQDTKAPYVFDKEKGGVVKSKRLKPDLVLELAVSTFAPVEPWIWSPDADVVGLDRSVVEVGA